MTGLRRLALGLLREALARWAREAYFYAERDGRIIWCLGNREQAERDLRSQLTL